MKWEFTVADLGNLILGMLALALAAMAYWGDRSRVKVKARMSQRFDPKLPDRPIIVIIEVVNTGGKPCRIQEVGIELLIRPFEQVATPKKVSSRYHLQCDSELLDADGGKLEFQSGPLTDEQLAQIGKPKGTAYVQLTTGKTIRTKFHTMDRLDPKKA
jgi:hypothetical protein